MWKLKYDSDQWKYICFKDKHPHYYLVTDKDHQKLADKLNELEAENERLRKEYGELKEKYDSLENAAMESGECY
jgi:predicted nuclease with TOPRIM domain